MKTEIKEKKRSVTPDVCRGIAIFLVVWGHVLQQGLNGVANVPENIIVKFIYSFHMPLFVLISGYFFYGSQKKKNVRELVLNRAGSLLKILLIWHTIHYVCALMLEKSAGGAGGFSFVTWWRAFLEGYWFLWAMLFCTIAVGITVKWLPKRFWVLGFLLFLPLALLSPCRWVIVSVYPFFLAGFWYGGYLQEGKKTVIRLKYAALPFFCGLLWFYYGIPAVGNSEWMAMANAGLAFVKKNIGITELAGQAGRVLLYYLLGLSGSVSVIVLVDMLTKKWNGIAPVRILGKLGQYSLQIYILQRVLVELISGNCYGMMVNYTGRNIVAGNIGLFTWLFSVLISLLCTLLLYGIIRYVLRGKAGFYLFGR